MHASDPVPEIAFSEAAQRHDNISHSDCNENHDIDGWSSIIIQLITFAVITDNKSMHDFFLTVL